MARFLDTSSLKKDAAIKADSLVLSIVPDTRLRIRGTAVHPDPTQKRTIPKTGRNEPCPCGSAKKFKNCHGRPITQRTPEELDKLRGEIAKEEVKVLHKDGTSSMVMAEVETPPKSES